MKSAMSRLIIGVLSVLLFGTAAFGYSYPIRPNAGSSCEGTRPGLSHTIPQMPPGGPGGGCRYMMKYAGDGSLAYYPGKFSPATFDRNSATSFIDHEGLLVPVARNDEATYTGLRRVRNLLADDSSNDFSVASWNKRTSATVTGTNVINLAANADSRVEYDIINVAYTGKTFVFSVVLSGSGQIVLRIQDTAPSYSSTQKTITLTSTPTRYSVSRTIGDYGTTIYVGIKNLDANVKTVTATNAQLEETTGQTITAPSEYVSTHTAYDGLAVKGVRYFSTTNANTVNGTTGVVTEATGAALTTGKGFWYQPATTNKIAGAYNAVGPDMVGSELLTTTADRDMSGANNWTGGSLGTFNVNSTVAGKLYMLGNGGNDYATRSSILAVGKVYFISLKARLNAGASTTIFVGNALAGVAASDNFSITPTSTEQTFTGTITCTNTTLTIGIGVTGFNGIAFEIDDVSVKEIGSAKSDGTFVSGLGTGAKNSFSTSWSTAIPGISVLGGGGGAAGSELLTGTDIDMSGANNWIGTSLGTFDVNSTVAGKMYILGNGGDDYALLANKTTIGHVYQISLKARLNAGASTEIRMGNVGVAGVPGNYVLFTPTAVEDTYTGTFVAYTTTLGVGIPGTGFNGVAFEIDDVSLKEVATASYVEVVSDSAKLATAKLNRLIPSGKVYKADNSTGAYDLTIDLTGNLSAATHTVSLYARGASAADDAIQLGDATTGVGDAIALTDEYQLISYTYTAAAAGMKITIPAGDTVYFTLMQAQTGTVATLPVVVEGAAASTVRDDWVAPVADGINFSQAAGTVTVVWTAGFDSSSMPNGSTVAVISSNTAINSIFSIIRSGGGVPQVYAYDGTTYKILTIPEFSKGDTITFKTTWSKARNKLNVYASTAAGTGWATAAAYDGAFTLGSYWYIGYNSAYPFSIANITVTNSFDKAGL